MLKNLEDKFNQYCNSKNFEINENQFLVIKKLQDYYKKTLNHISLNFSLKMILKRFLSLWRCRCWKNNDLKFLL